MITRTFENQSFHLTLQHHMASLIVGVHDCKGLQHLILNVCQMALLLHINSTVVLRQHGLVLFAFVNRFGMLLSFVVFHLNNHIE